MSESATRYTTPSFFDSFSGASAGAAGAPGAAGVAGAPGAVAGFGVTGNGAGAVAAGAVPAAGAGAAPAVAGTSITGVVAVAPGGVAGFFTAFWSGLISIAGVTAVAQPGGSKRDDAVIAAADARDMAMVMMGERHFRH